jgi:hypothetical protein
VRTPSLVSPMMLLAAACVALSVAGMHLDLERFITPETGLGYALGIVGGGAMLLLLIYPARKRAAWLAGIGSVAAWFRIHMVLGIVGPMLVLFHANFRPGAINSNVALVCMLVVSGSGLIGRYFYSRMHTSLYGSQTTLRELRAQISRLQSVSPALSFFPDFNEQLSAAAERITGMLSRTPGFLRPAMAPVFAWQARREMRRRIRGAGLLHAVRHLESPSVIQRNSMLAQQLARRHIDLARRVSELATYERLFALWHLLHLPLFFMLLVAGIVHVVAVHLY